MPGRACALDTGSVEFLLVSGIVLVLLVAALALIAWRRSASSRGDHAAMRHGDRVAREQAERGRTEAYVYSGNYASGSSGT
jgi:hypothetical protein